MLTMKSIFPKKKDSSTIDLIKKTMVNVGDWPSWPGGVVSGRIFYSEVAMVYVMMLDKALIESIVEDTLLVEEIMIYLI